MVCPDLKMEESTSIEGERVRIYICRIRQELKDLHAEGKQEQKEIESNEQKFLALELPSRHNQGEYSMERYLGKN